MRTAIKRKAEPEKEPVLKTLLKENLRLDCDEQDTLLDSFIKASREAIEARIHRTCISTTYELFFDKFPKVIELYRPPVQSVTSVKYYDTDEVLQTIDPADYIIDFNSLPPRITPTDTWPTPQDRTGAIVVEYIAGYGDAEDTVPEAIKQAMRMLASDIYEHPEANVELKLAENKSYHFLLAAYAVPYLGEPDE